MTAKQLESEKENIKIQMDEAYQSKNDVKFKSLCTKLTLINEQLEKG